MNIVLTTITSLMFILLAVKQFLSNRRVIHPDPEKTDIIPYIGGSAFLNLVFRSMSAGPSASGLVFSVLLGVVSIFLVSVSFLQFKGVVRKYVWTAISVQLMSGVWNLLCMAGIADDIGDVIYQTLCVVLCLTMCAVYIYGIYCRLIDVRSVMRSGSVWANVTMAVDSVYAVIIMGMTVIYLLATVWTGTGNPYVGYVFAVVYASLYIALSVRMLDASVFVFMTDHERKIIESMKISHIDNVQDNDGVALLYKNLYEKILEYFAETKAYLNPNLTINDVVAVVLSNKLYISKAVNRFTGRNFCQFVNYYRVIHAIELFRDNTDLKVHELASRSGFNSAVSFGMAFKLYMGEKPGDWCRRERYRMDKLKK